MLKNNVEEILEIWNSEVKGSALPYNYSIEVVCREKEFFTTKTKSFKQRVAELKYFMKEGEETFLLYRKELRMPSKIKNVQQFKIDNEYIDMLYKHFLYECMGSFSVTIRELQKANEIAPYDLVKDRLTADPKFAGYVVETQEADDWFEKGDTFDVFTQADDGWGVFTAHDIARKNNGIFKIPGNICKVIEQPTTPIEIINQPKLIL